MKSTFDEYCSELSAEAARLAGETELQARYAHQDSFNFGRRVERIECARRNLWLRILWLVVGVVIGVAVGAGCIEALTMGMR